MPIQSIALQVRMNLRARMKLRVYPERKSIKDKRHHTEKRNPNRLKQISILARSITKRKSDIRGSGELENAPQRKIHKTE
jgi:hypothetical protein